MHHKRGRPRSRRAGCKLCKPWKKNGIPTNHPEGEKHSDHVRRRAAMLDHREYLRTESTGGQQGSTGPS